MSIENKDDTTTSTTDATKVAKGAADDSVDAKSKLKSDEAKHEGDKTASDKADTAKFSAEYVQELREENKKYRLKAKELEDKLTESKSNGEADANKLAKDSKESLDKVNKLHVAFEKRLINAELAQVAAKEGLIDSDAFKMVDLSSVKVSEEGEVIGLDKIMQDLKTNKPYLFKLSSNTNEKAKNLHPADDNNKRPTYETKADLDKAKRELLASLR